jgi:FixJ family two-component response regulator
MPIMNGFEIQSHFRDISPSTRVIVLTAHDDPSLCATALNAGASAFLTKPCNYEEFLAAVWRALAAT